MRASTAPIPAKMCSGVRLPAVETALVGAVLVTSYHSLRDAELRGPDCVGRTPSLRSLVGFRPAADRRRGEPGDEPFRRVLAPPDRRLHGARAEQVTGHLDRPVDRERVEQGR